MHNKRQYVVAVFFGILLCLCMTTQVSATANQEKNTTITQNDDKRVTIKVAYYQLDGFFEYDENGNECGYGVDYLNEIARYANINWEYVPVDSWEKIGDMMRSGEVDVRMPVSEPSTPSEIYNYTVEDILSSYHAIMTRKDREDLYYKDYSRIGTLKIAVVPNLIEKTGMSDYFSSLGISSSNLKYFDDYNQCKAALDKGNVDAVMSNVMDLTDDMKVLDKFAVTKNYITTMKSNPYYSLINSAMTELELENPSFQTNLYEKYYPERAIEPFTKEEYQYMGNKDKLTVGVFTDRKPVSYYDEKTKSFKGIAIDLASLLSKKIGIPFEYVAITTSNPKDMLKKIDLIMPVAQSGDFSKYFATTNLLDTEILYAVRNGEKSPKNGDKVGVLTTTKGIADLIRKQGDYKIVQYKTSREALGALQDGQIDAFANASYVMNWQLENPRYDGLTTVNYQSIPMEYFDVILMDIRMPVMDGLEATKAIRALERKDAQEVTIIAMSANAYEEDVQSSLQAGMDSHLAKPVEPQKMYDTIEQYIGKKHKM